MELDSKASADKEDGYVSGPAKRETERASTPSAPKRRTWTAGSAIGADAQNNGVKTKIEQDGFPRPEDIAIAAAFSSIPPDANLMMGNRWIVDTGASQHMVAKTNIDRNQIILASKPYKLHTANGKVETRERYRAYIPTLDDYVEAVVLDNTPAAISVGQLIQVGYSFRWDQTTPATLINPEGDEIELLVDHNVPYLANFTSDQAAAVAHEGDISGDQAPTLVMRERSPAGSAADFCEFYKERIAEVNDNGAAAALEESVNTSMEAKQGSMEGGGESSVGGGPLRAAPDDGADRYENPDHGGSSGSGGPQDQLAGPVDVEDPRDDPDRQAKQKGTPVCQPGDLHLGSNYTSLATTASSITPRTAPVVSAGSQT